MQYEQLELPIEQLADKGLQRGTPRPSRWRLVSDGNRPRLMEALYRADGRESKEHPMHGVLTGLAEAFYTRLGRAQARAAMALEDFSPSALLDRLEATEAVLEQLDA
jgi:hypothetical protein